ncbi:MAG: hypothetical protein U1F27_11960 [Turneriella sp.]
MPTLIANFYADKPLLRHFGAGANFFECQREGGFYSRAATEVELGEFERLVGAKKQR